MATNHTTNYNLNLWEPQDDFVREEFNENIRKTDEVLAELNAALKTKGNCCITTGSYVGDGTYGEQHPNVLTFSKPPILVFLATEDYSAFMVRGCPSATGSYDYLGSLLHVTWSGNSVSWYSRDAQTQINLEGYVVRYVALVLA